MKNKLILLLSVIFSLSFSGLTAQPGAISKSDSGASVPEAQIDGQLISVYRASDLDTLLPNKIYWLKNDIDMGSTSIYVPTGTAQIRGNGFSTRLFSTADNYTMFVSPPGGSGNLFLDKMTIEVSGTNSQVFDLVDASGFNAVEINVVNFEDCTSLGELEGYRQVLEFNTGRFGGTPTLTLSGTWIGGYKTTTSITRGLSAGMTGALYEAGTAFVMNNRFYSDMNLDLPASASFVDFVPANFSSSGLLQIIGAIISRDGVFDTEDTNILPNISNTALEAKYRDNVGVENTFEGGLLTVTAEAVTTISTQGVYVDVGGTWTASDLSHFESNANGQLENAGNNPVEFLGNISMAVDGPPLDELRIKIVKWNGVTFEDMKGQTRAVSNNVGGADVAFFGFTFPVTLNQGEYIKLQIANLSGTGNVTAEIDSELFINRR